MADGSIEFSVELDAKAAEKELTSLAKKIRQLEVDLAVKNKRKTALEAELERAGVAADQAKAKLAELVAERDRLKSLTPADGSEYLTAGSRLSAVAQEIKEQEAIAKETDREFSKAASAVDKCNKEVETLNAKLDATKELYGKTAQEAAKLADATEETGDEAEKSAEKGKEAANIATKAIDKVKSRLEEARERVQKFGDRIMGMVSSLFVFSLINKALGSLRSYLAEMIKKDEQAQAAIAKLKAALLTLAQPIVNVVIPAFTRLVELLAKVAATAARIVSKLFGTTVEASAAQAQAANAVTDTNESLGGQSDALRDTAKAAKEAEKALAGFDEIEKLTSGHADDLSDGSDDTGLNQMDSGSGEQLDFKSVIKDQLDAIVELFAGAALLALGAILTFSGAHFLLGIALMVIGALAIWDAITEDPEAIKQWIKDHAKEITKFLLISAAVTFVIGTILIIAGQILIGITLILIGVGELVAAYEINKDEVNQWIEERMQEIVDTLMQVPVLALVVGILLLFTPLFLVGIGLIQKGAEAIAEDFEPVVDEVIQWIEDRMQEIVDTLMQVPVLALVVGILLLFTPLFLVGIGLIQKGAEAIAEDFEPVVDEVIQWIEDRMQEVVDALMEIPVLALVVGILLLFTPLFLVGIGLIQKGAEAIAEDFEPVVDEVIQWIEDRMQEVVDALMEIPVLELVIGILLLFTPLFLVGIGLIQRGAEAIEEDFEPNINVIIEWITDTVKKIFEEIQKNKLFLFILGILLVLSGVGIPIGLGLIMRVIKDIFPGDEKKPEWDWLKEKIDKISKEITDRLKEKSKLALGAILLLSGIAPGLGLKMIKEGLEGSDEDVDWDYLPEQTEEAAKATEDVIKEKDKPISEKIAEAAKKAEEVIKEKSESVPDTVGETCETCEDKLDELIKQIESAQSTATNFSKTLSGLDFSFQPTRGLSDIIGGLGSLGGIPIPGLARGAVIPPNREFLAVLGDQRSGTNIETPLATMVEAFRMALADSGGTYGNRPISITLELDRQQFAQAVYYANNDETQRVGTRFVEIT